MVRRLIAGILLAFAPLLAAQELFFETPRVFIDGNVRFPQLSSTDRGGVLVYQELLQQEEDSGLVEVLLRFSTSGRDWSPARRLAAGIRYEGASVPPVFDLAATDEGEMLLAISDFELSAPGESRSVITLQLSADFGRSFREVEVFSGDIRLVNPRVFASADGGWYLVLEELVALAGANRLLYAYSDDGLDWSELRAFPVNLDQTGTQSDVTHIGSGSRDLFLFVGENIAAPTGTGPIGTSGEPVPFPDLPQVYAVYTDDSGVSWSATDPETGIEAAPRASVAASVSLDNVNQDELIPFFYLRSNYDIWPALGMIGSWTDLEMQRPDVSSVGSTGIAMAFEAGLRFSSQNTRQLAYVELSRDGNISGQIELITASSLDNVRVSYNQPRLVEFDGTPVLTAYIDPQRGGDVEVYQRTRLGWRRRAVAEDQFAAFPTVAEINDNLHVFWHGRTDSEPGLPTRMVDLEPDQRTLPPVVSGVNFGLGERSAQSVARFSWVPRTDASGVVGYSTLWSRSPDDVAPRSTASVSGTSAAFDATADGRWYLHIRAVDRAGNWSPQETVSFFRDTTPPAPVAFDQPPLDDEGFLTSNTFRLTWEAPELDVSGGPEIVDRYLYDFVRVGGPSTEPATFPVFEPRVPVVTESPLVQRNNYDNGLWALSVQAIDSVGNVGEAAVLYFRLNKYVPVTLITTLTAIEDPLGRYTIDIVGRGFTANGEIVQVILDQDRQPPYDLVYDQNDPGFQVFDDRSMSGPLLDAVETGSYFVGLVHSERGLEFSRSRLTIEQNGTVKFGNFTVLRAPEFSAAGFARVLAPVNLLAWVVVALLLVIAFFSGSRAVVIAREGVLLRHEARALITGGPLAIEEKQRRVMEMQKQGMGLRVKFTLFIVALVVAVVGGLAVGLGTVTLNSQRDVLVGGLKDRVDVLMESIAAPAGDALLDPLFNQGDIDALPTRTRAMDEALYATVTGPLDQFAPDEFPDSFNYVWGTNDPVLEAQGAGDEVVEDLLSTRAAAGIERTPVSPGNSLFFGRTRLDDPATQRITVMAEVVDRIGRERLGSLIQSREIEFAQADALRRQIADLPAGADTTRLEQQRQQSLRSFRSLDDQVRSQLTEIGLDAAALIRYHSLDGEFSYGVPESLDELEGDILSARDALAEKPEQAVLLDSPVLSVPQFLPTAFDADLSDHIFYQVAVEPDISDLPTDAEALAALDGANLDTISYFRGAVRLGVTTELIVEQIAESRGSIIRVTALIAALAILAGVFGALLLATLVVRPIDELVRGVEKIGSTKDKTTLTEDPIEVKSRDELFRLADAVNEMSEGLAAAAAADKDLKATSDLQKMFIPLETDGSRKLTYAKQEYEDVAFFGYYEGADALSGDYFTWVELSEARPGSFAFIKCDVAGHGVKAAFIMSEVATMFANRVSDWNAKGARIDVVKYLQDVNTHLNDFGFAGIFAAMTVGILDSSTGKIDLSHAGDTEQRIFRSRTMRVDEEELNLDAPATGGIPPFMLTPETYRRYAFRLDAGDIMLLATDGIEESARYLRGDEFDRRTGQYTMLFPTEEERDEVFANVPERFHYSMLWDEKEHFVREDFSTERLVAIVEQVMAQGTYQLERGTTRNPDERLHFDYSGLPPTGESLVTAVMAAEKVWRLDRAPRGADVELVRVDTRVAAFMEERLSNYKQLFGEPVPVEERPDYNEALDNPEKAIQKEYVYFAGLLEEEQQDDLTILTIRKK